MTTTPPSIDALRDVRAASCGPVGAPTVTADLSENVILTTLDDLHNWSRLSSLWPLLYGTACCFIEFAALLGSRFDFDRFGLVPRSSPRQADLLIVAGTVTMKMGPALVRLYEQMPEPKYVIAMGACTITGGMFSADSTTAVRGVDKLIPVDLYLPGCPPRPEAIFDVETVFLYPWAVAFSRLGLLAFIEALIFITILVIALAYAWRKGALEWS